MKKLLTKLLFFISITVFILILMSGLLFRTINQGDYYRLEKKFDNLIVGNSHTNRAFNDTIIQNSKNFSSSAESVFYTYLKLEKIVNNNEVKNVFLLFSNNCIPEVYDDYIWKETYIGRSYPVTHPFMKWDEKKLLAKKNIKSLIRIQSLSIRKDLEFLVFNKCNSYKFYNWGGYDYSYVNELDSLLKVVKMIKKEPIKDFKYSKYGLLYLDKIIDLCVSKKINLYLVRTPVHQSWEKLENEYYFQKILKEKYRKVCFLDFKDYPLKNNFYGDLNHLNHFGATKFSIFFNNLLKNGLLIKENKQEFINQEIKKEVISIR